MVNQLKCFGLVLVLAGLTAIGCEKQNKPAADAAEPPRKIGPAATVPAGFFLDKAPEGIKDLAAIKSTAKDGDEVTVRAVVGGEEAPFSADSAVIKIIDPSVMTCDKMGMADCKTPWDACCHQADVVAKGATMQLVDASGAPLKGTLEGVGNLKPGKSVVIQGKVRIVGGKGMMIEASHAYAGT